MKRFHDWPEKLNAFLASQARAPFKWGKRDCALTAFSALATMTGTDLGKPFRGKYTCKDEADQVIAAFSGGTLEPAVDKLFSAAGAKPVPVLRAQRGDAVLADTELGPSLGVVGQDGVYFAAPRGFLVLPLRMCRRAWRIG